MIQIDGGQVFNEGIFRAIVVDNADPEGRMRVQVALPEIYGASNSPWCLTLTNGLESVFEPGAMVLVMFENGDPDRPVVIGSFPTAAEFRFPASPSLRATDDSTTSVAGGTGGGQVTLTFAKTPSGDAIQLLEPSTRARPKAGHVAVLRRGRNLVEVDDTPGASRVKLMSGDGTTLEMGPNGATSLVASGALTEWIRANRISVTLGTSIRRTSGVLIEEAGSAATYAASGPLTLISKRDYSLSALNGIEAFSGSRKTTVSGKIETTSSSSVDTTIGNSVRVCGGESSTVAGVSHSVMVGGIPGKGSITMKALAGNVGMQTMAGSATHANPLGVVGITQQGTGALVGKTLSIRTDSADLLLLLNELINTLVGLTTIPAAIGTPLTLNPATIALLNGISSRLVAMRSVEPVVPIVTP